MNAGTWSYFSRLFKIQSWIFVIRSIKILQFCIGLEVFMAVTVKNAAVLYVTPCSLLKFTSISEEPAASICSKEDFLKVKVVVSSKLLVGYSQTVWWQISQDSILCKEYCLQCAGWGVLLNSDFQKQQYAFGWHIFRDCCTKYWFLFMFLTWFNIPGDSNLNLQWHCCETLNLAWLCYVCSINWSSSVACTVIVHADNPELNVFLTVHHNLTVY